MTTVRVLNDAGIQRFREYIAAAKVNPSLPTPTETLEDGRFSEPLTPALEIESGRFVNAYDFGVYLNTVFGAVESREISRNHALWSWLALFFFDEITKTGSSGARKILEEALY